MRFRQLLTLIAAVGVTGCLDTEGPVAVVSTLSKSVGSDLQRAAAGGRLPAPLAVTALASDGTPVVRVSVRWEIVSGDGASLSDSVTLTDGNGIGQVELTLGPAVGTYVVRATVAGVSGDGVTFSAEATAAPVIASVMPTAFASGDTVLLAGTNLHLATRFEVDGLVAPAIQVSVVGVGAQIQIPFCLPDGPVSIRALVGGTPSAPVSGEYTGRVQPITLALGGFVSIPAGGLSACNQLPASAEEAQYLVTPQLTRQAPDSATYRLQVGDVATAVAAVPAPRTAATPRERFHRHLREIERNPPAPISQEVTAAPAASGPTIGVGHNRDFRVCNSVTCNGVEDFSNVRAEARYVGRHAAIYVDDDAPAPGLTDADITALGAQFDDVLYDVDTRAFGAESDVDGDELVIILMTPVVNSLTPAEQCETSFVTGFFFPLDLNPFFARDPRSNQSEIFYSFVPDPSGEFTCTHSVDRIRNSVGVTFVHEFQHMISYHQRVLLRGGDAETLWLNEALSHLAEELAARRFRDVGDQASFSRFAIGNLINAYDFLTDPEATFVLATEGTGTLVERGAGWLFLRWLVDNFGEGITRRLVETNRLGVENLEAATGLPIARLLAEWALANWVSDLPDFTPTGRLAYSSWEFRTTYSSLNEQSPQVFERPFPLVPFGVTAGGQPLVRSGVLRGGLGPYVLVGQPAGAAAVMLDLTELSGAPFAAAGGVQLNVLRIR